MAPDVPDLEALENLDRTNKLGRVGQGSVGSIKRGTAAAQLGGCSFACVITARVVILVLSGAAPAASAHLSFSSDGPPVKLIDTGKQSFPYAYAPSIIFADGLWHAY